MRLIDADALAKTLGITNMNCNKCEQGFNGRCTRGKAFVTACMAIEEAPTVMGKGRWIETEPSGVWTSVYHCSECGGSVLSCKVDLPKYCGHCGARMEENNETD